MLKYRKKWTRYNLHLSSLSLISLFNNDMEVTSVQFPWATVGHCSFCGFNQHGKYGLLQGIAQVLLDNWKNYKIPKWSRIYKNCIFLDVSKVPLKLKCFQTQSRLCTFVYSPEEISFSAFSSKYDSMPEKETSIP